MMNGKFQVKWSLAVLISLGLTIGFYLNSQASVQNTAEIDLQTKSRILSSTVQITMVAVLQPENKPHGFLSQVKVKELIQKGQGYVEANGLGTVVNANGESLIITHNHWGSMLVEADLVEIYDADGSCLIGLSGNDLKKLLRYQDLGTAVLAAPAGLNLPSAILGNSQSVIEDDRVLITQHDPDQTKVVKVIEAQVSKLGIFEGLQAWTLRTINGTIEPGDSGGGIWMNGELVGNTWAVERTINWKFWTWESLKPEKISTHTSYAARFSERAQMWMNTCFEDESESKADQGTRFEISQ